MSESKKTVVPEFISELDGGVFESKLSASLNAVALGVLNNGGKGKVIVEMDISRLNNSIEEKRIMISHKLKFTAPTPRGKSSEEDTTETPMYVGKGGKLTVMQEDQGSLFSINGELDRKIKAAN
ncbi:hypothetical protein [Xenorhabdus bovienii]|uniref:hypothetical protein n=1 Tax=Xenorhabdus bovienii TaxID=40576 RepID=UPI0023B21E03|nr:hypothetical protein [Xenorhabdus bovienii]MDE9466416.1 hypothetical protein [Xenorhabdus bovienii]MDE9483142.1 hypothetical protein [Xenorhabdus bovienii]MDE9487794.1 hypothetical protein [Xenorhabdus bovienii]